ncbi:hypothetical protein ACL02S_22050 [Nocardia sp. 004]|uniref:LppU family putative lipoprotein n=1 Tax=Nocardia sp. 004 TaxID=3385978 RepID=UPI0039A04629
MSRQLTRGGLAVAGLAGAIGLSLLGCSSTIDGFAQPAMDNQMVDAVSLTDTPRPSSGNPAPNSSKTEGSIDFQADIDDCVNLGRTVDDATIEKASCGSRASNYRVIDKKAKSSQCVDDADSYYAESLNGVELGALCLDIDWVVGGCMDIGGDDPKHIDCTDPAPIHGVKVIEIQTGTDDVEECSSSGGYVYDERRFVVCVEEF